MTYSGRHDPITVTVGSGADDGAAGEGDDVGVWIDEVVGGSGDDTLIGRGVSPSQGDLGNESLTGGPGDDLLRAFDRAADTTLDCGEGADRADVDIADPAAAGCETVSRR